MTVERYPNLEEEVGGSIPECEISSLLDKKSLACGQLPPMLWHWPIGLLSPEKKERKKERVEKANTNQKGHCD